ncbi:MAG: hypothetical protein GY928_18375 [Colwellia sp.]|nr:hypothetical protein [Colwellia sp.]
MKKITLIVFAILLSLLAYQYCFTKDNNKPFLVEYSFQMKNNLGRNLENIKINYSLPLSLNINEIDDDISIRIADQGQSYISSNINNFVAHETKNLSFKATLSFEEAAEQLSITSPVYIYNTSPSSDRESLLELYIASDSPADFLRKNADLQAVIFLASELSKLGQKVRIVSGIKLQTKIKESPSCWLQHFEKNQWKNITASNEERLPFKIMLPDNEITQNTCQNSIVDVWGLDVKKLQISLKNSI